MDRVTNRLVFFERGMGASLLTDDYISFVMPGNPPAAMTGDNCREFVLHNNRIVHSPQQARG